MSNEAIVNKPGHGECKYNVFGKVGIHLVYNIINAYLSELSNDYIKID